MGRHVVALCMLVASAGAVHARECSDGDRLTVAALSPALSAQVDGLHRGDALQTWHDASGAEQPLCHLVDLARAELTRGTFAPMPITVQRDGAVRSIVLSGGRHEIDWVQSGSSDGARASQALLTARAQARSGAFERARAAMSGLDSLNAADHALVIEQALVWLEADPDRESAFRLAQRLVELRDGAPARERARALAIRGRGALLKRDLAGATADATLAAQAIGDEKSLIGAQVALLQGAIAYLRAQNDEAERHYRAALATIEAIAPNGVLVANALSNIAALQVARGQPAAALDDYGRALRILALAGPGTYAEARIYYNRGLSLTELRRLGDAERDVLAAVDRFGRVQPQGPEHLQAQAQLAEVYIARGQYALAESRLATLLPALQRRAPQDYNTLAVEHTLALTQARLKRYDESLASFRALLAKLGTERPDSLRADTLNAYGQTLAEHGQLDAAIDTLTAALAGYEATQRRGLPTASALLARGDARRQRGQLDAADADLQEALALRVKLAPGSVLEAAAHHLLGKLQRARGDIDGALSRYHQAISLLERERWLQSENAELRALWTATYADFYREPLDLLMEQQRLQEAFELDQRYRGRELALALARQGEGIDARLAAERTVDLASARARLAPTQALVAFITTGTRTWVLVLSRELFAAHAVPHGRAHWREQVDAMNVLWALPNPSEASRQATIARANRLYRELFVDSSAALAGIDRLLIVPDDALHDLAFAALVTAPGVDFAATRYFVESHALTIAVRPFSSDAASVSTSRALLALGDPAVPPSMRTTNAMMQTASTPSVVGTTMRLRGVGDAPLPAARREALAIAALYGADARALVGDAAAENQVTASSAGMLHFAAHVVLDPVQPLDSYVSLAAGGEADGRLSAREIAASKPVSRDLVVLAGCASVQGSDAAGEGLLGIARAWHVAGAQRVLATQWAIDDEATARFMVAFHRERRDEPLTDVALARTQRAWLAHARDNAWWRSERRGDALPFYWAAFQLSATRP